MVQKNKIAFLLSFDRSNIFCIVELLNKSQVEETVR